MGVVVNLAAGNESRVHVPSPKTPLKSETLNAPDTPFDLALRPSDFSDFHGQTKVKEQLLVMIEAAKIRSEPLDHVLLCGPPGLGKTTLANLIATAVGSRLQTTSGPQIERAGDLAGILTNLQEKDILFIDEIHRLHPSIEEYLYLRSRTSAWILSLIKVRRRGRSGSTCRLSP